MQKNYYLISIIIVTASMIPFFFMFERKRPHAREVMMLAVMVTLAVMSRAVFFMIPFFKPMLAVVIISAVGLGGRCGMLVGTLSVFVSNFMFGQGPWTVWQMLAAGACGLLAGILFSGRYRDRLTDTVCVCAYGLLASVFLYGPVMDTYSALMYTGRLSGRRFLAIYLTGLPVNIIHGFSTCLFLALFCRNMVRKLRRIKIKFKMDNSLPGHRE